MPGLQILIEKLLNNIDSVNAELKVALDFRLCELKSSTEEDKENYKKEISACMVLLIRKEEFTNAKLHRVTCSVNSLEEKAKENHINVSKDPVVLNLKNEQTRLKKQSDELGTLWERLRGLLPLVRNNRTW